MNVTWYADGARATVTDADGRKWWMAPLGLGKHMAMCDETGERRDGDSQAALLEALLGEDWRKWTGVR